MTADGHGSNGTLHGAVYPIGSCWPPHNDPSIRSTRSRHRHCRGVIAQCVCGRQGISIPWKVLPPLGTFLRSVVIALVLVIVSMYWRLQDVFVFVKLIALGTLFGFLSYWWTGEFRQDEIAAVRSLVLPRV